MPRKAASTEDAFLQTILDNPDDDVPRLVFADWLEEHGNPRGTFIRLQCQRAKLTRFDAGWAGLLADESRLFKQFEPEWSKQVRRLVDEVEYRRGFIEHVRITAAKFLKNAPRLFRLAPVSSIRVERLNASSVAQVMGHMASGRVRELDLGQNLLGKRAMEQLLEAASCRDLRTLRLCRCGLRESEMELLAAAPTLQSLQSLNMSDNDFGGEGMQLLAASTHLAALRDLNVNRDRLHDAGVIALARSTTLRLAKLSIGVNAIANEGAAALAQAPSLASLRSLDVETNHLSNVGVEAIANSPILRQLEYLNLSGNRISSKGVQILNDSPLLANLTYLNLKHNDIDKATAQTIPQRLNTPKMRELLF